MFKLVLTVLLIFLSSRNVIPSKQHYNEAEPFAFTKTRVAMLSSVLKSKRARQMNIAIMRAFVALRQMLIDHTELRLAIKEIKKKTDNYSNNNSKLFTTEV